MRTHQAPPENQDVPVEFRLSSYVYELPEERIARRPAEVRDGSRLLVVDRAANEQRLDAFARLPEILARRFPKGALMIANNSRVFPARIFGRRATGGRVELLLLTPLPLLHVKPLPDGRRSAEAEGLVRTAKRMPRSLGRPLS